MPCTQPLMPKLGREWATQTRIQTVTEQELDMQQDRYPPVNSPTFSKFAVLGVIQAREGETFLQLARLGKHEHMQTKIAPNPSPSARRTFARLCIAALVIFFAQIVYSSTSEHRVSMFPLLVCIFSPFCSIGFATLWKLPDLGISVNFRNLDDELTALHIAAQNGNLEVVQMLVAAGAAVLLKDVTGRTALEYAKGNAHKEVIACLTAASSRKSRGARGAD